MHAKFVIFGTLSVLLVMAVYTSSMLIVFAAEGDTSCRKLGTGAWICSVDNGDSTKTSVFCWKSGNTIKCEVESTAATGTPPSGDLKSAITGAIVKSHAGAVGGDATTGENKTSFMGGKTLKYGGALKGGETENNAPPNNTNTLQ